MTDDVPQRVSVRTDPEKDLAHRYETIRAAAEFWDVGNNKDAILRSCDAAGRLVENVEEALQHPDLPPGLAEELAETVSTRQITVDYQPPNVEAAPARDHDG
jgi:hypothetical protein